MRQVNKDLLEIGVNYVISQIVWNRNNFIRTESDKFTCNTLMKIGLAI